MLGSEARIPFKTPGRGNIRGFFRNGLSIKTQLTIMGLAIASALAAAFIVTIAGLRYVENVHMSAIRNEGVFHELMEIKASALSTIMLEPASPDTGSVFTDAGLSIQHSSRTALDNIGSAEMRRRFEGILSQWREYERDSRSLIRLSAADPGAAKEGVAALYKRSFVPFQKGLESFIVQWLEMATRVERDAAESIRLVKWSVSVLILIIAAAVVATMVVITRSINANIREREEDHRLLRQSETLLNETQRIARIGGWEFDIKRQAMYWTDEVYRIHGMRREDIPRGSTAHIDKSVECYPSESRAVILAAFQKCVAEGISYDLEFPFISVMGRQMWIRTSAKPVYENGDIVKVVGDIMDITDRKQAEEELLRFFNLVPDMVCVASVDGHFLKINAMWEKVLGFSERELLETPFLEFIHPADRDATMKEVARQIGGEATIEFVNRYRCKDGAYRWLEWMAMPSPDKKQLFAAARDITGRKQAAEELMRAKEAAEEATKLKDKFVSLVAHDLKTPLTGMVGFLQLLQRDVAGLPGNNGSKAVLERAIDSGKQMARLIDDLLNLNRLKTGQLTLNKEMFDAKYLGAKMCTDFSYFAESKGIRLVNLIPDGSIVFADKILLGEAMQNLVSNAIKFCREGDAVTISFAGSGQPAIQVTDTGPGMTAEKLSRLFKYETPVSTVGTGGETGSGFGLGLAKDIMLLHGGDLRAASEAGKGCVFTLTLPPNPVLSFPP